MRIDSAAPPYNPHRGEAPGASAGTTPQHKPAIGDMTEAGLDIADYFTPRPGAALAPLLLPTSANIDALATHAAQAFKQFLADHDIPAAPSTISYASDGTMQLPNDYPHADALRQALADDPAMERELRTLNALTSHFAAMKPSLAFSQEYTAAQSSTSVDAVLARYSYLFSSHRQSANTALAFSPDGTLTPMADGKPYAGVNLSV